MKPIKKFLIEVTHELLYNIVFEANKIKYDVLSEQFREKTGYRPMDFFGFKSGPRGWFKFIKGIPGLQGKRNISIADGDDECVYKMFNTTYLKENGVDISSVAKYREMLLLECCQILKNHFNNLENCKDENDNTPLHFIAALPGLNYSCSTLVKYLLQAGIDPLATSRNRQNFLHIIFGRYKAKRHSGGILYFPHDLYTGEHVGTTKWFVEDRDELLHLLFEELWQAQTSLLVKAQDIRGNTVMHEFAIASPIEEQNFDEGCICQQLHNLGAIVRISNNFGAFPLHYAFNPPIFKFLVENSAPISAKDDDDNTPVLFILKRSAELAFAETSAWYELVDLAFLKSFDNMSRRSLPKALKLLKNLIQILEQLGYYAWIPDGEKNVAINIILIAIRLASYKLEEIGSIHHDTTPLRLLLVELLSNTLRSHTSSSDMKRQEVKGQSFLHVLLDMPDDTKHVIVEEAEILLSLKLLLNHGVDVNAVNSQGRTPLDITYKHLDKAPNLYKKCAEILMEKGAIAGSSLLLSGVNQRMANLRMRNEIRKLRSCPTRHANYARRLTDPNSQVAVVGNYRYSNQDSIGTGAFSNIFVAIKDENVDSTSGTIECRAYALKRLDKAKINPQEIKREITTLLSISGDCDNIIKCHESVEDPFFQYLCLDLMDGDLNEFVTNNGVNIVLKKDPAIPVQATKEIINGLAFLHEQEYIHRDLKPGNILYTTDPSLHFKIADFGLTKNMSTFSTMMSTRGSGVAMAPGTRCWMAPELVGMISREHTKESDLFSLGLVLHYFLTLGKHPFAKESEERAHIIERNIEEMQIHLDKGLHPEAISFLHNVLMKDPSKRPPANTLDQHPFLWRESKKIDFLKAVGDQPEAEKPANHPNSQLEQRLQNTHTGKIASVTHWNVVIKELYDEMTKTWKLKKYRTNMLIDLIRFIRNAYAHKQGKSLQLQEDLDKNIFLRKYPSLVLDVLIVVQQLGFHEDESRSNIRQALNSDTQQCQK